MEMNNLTKSVLFITIIAILVVIIAPIFTVHTDSDTLDVFIIDGQSNAAYQNVEGSVDLEVVNSELKAPTHNLYYYGTSVRPSMWNDNLNSMSIRPMYENGSYIVGGLVAPFGYYISEKSGRDVLVIDVGISAQSITNLIPGSTGGDWGISIIDKALNSITGYSHIHMVGWVWLQGEADRTMPVDTYKSYFMDLDDWYRSIDSNTCYIVEMSQSRGGNAYTAQKQLISNNQTIVSGIDTSTWGGTDKMLDALHYSQASRIIIAETVVGLMHIPSYGEMGYLNDLIGVVPLLIIIGLIIAVIAVIYVKNR